MHSKEYDCGHQVSGYLKEIVFVYSLGVRTTESLLVIQLLCIRPFY